jgi:predicted HAD superfamily Cof-like phosphohydrolase
MTNYQKVVDFNKTFGVKIYDKADSTLFDIDSKLVSYRMALNKEEFRELNDAVKQNDSVEAIDAILDILYVVYGMGCSFGYNMDDVMRELEFGGAGLDQTCFQLTKQFNISSGIQNMVGFNLDENKEIITFHINTIGDSMKELDQFVAAKDMEKVIITLSKLLKVVYSMGVSFNIDVDYGFNLVHESNMSKVCVDEAEAIKTVQYYTAAFKDGFEPYDTPNYRLSDDGSKYIVYNVSSSKILKSVNYHIVDLSSLVNLHI